MKFEEVLKLLREGRMLKRKHWSGYWKMEGKNIIMYCKDGSVIDLRSTEDIFYTLSNTVTDDWEIATKENSQLLRGELV